MLRKPFISTRQPSINSLVQDGWLSHIRTPFSPKPGERTRGIHADGHRSVRMRSPAWSGRIGSWLEHAMSLRRAGTFSPVHAVFSHAPETCSTAFLTASRQSHHQHYGTLRKHAENRSGRRLEGFSRVISQVCLRIGENATRGHPSNATARNALNPTVKRTESLSSCDWA